MPRFKLTVEYAGTRYSGWQIQKNARTIQGEIDRAMAELRKQEATVQLIQRRIEKEVASASQNTSTATIMAMRSIRTGRRRSPKRPAAARLN